jgi:hypothetical protein
MGGILSWNCCLGTELCSQVLRGVHGDDARIIEEVVA